MPELSYELEQYIAKKLEEAADANNCDFKATYQPELDRIHERCVALYTRGKELIATIPEEDLGRCRRLYDDRRRVGSPFSDQLCATFVDGREVVVPAYVSMIEEVRKLKELLA